MIASVAHKTPGIILDKLTRLLNALQEVKNNYEQVAKRIQNLQLKIIPARTGTGKQTICE